MDEDEFNKILKDLQRWDMGAFIFEVSACAFFAIAAAVCMYWLAS